MDTHTNKAMHSSIIKTIVGRSLYSVRDSANTVATCLACCAVIVFATGCGKNSGGREESKSKHTEVAELLKKESGKSGQSVHSKIIGTWKSTSEETDFIRTFTADNKWSGSVMLKPTINGVKLAASPVAEDGVWRVDGNKLMSTREHIARPITKVGAEETYTVIRIDDTTMVWEGVNGTGNWKRVR